MGRPTWGWAAMWAPRGRTWDSWPFVPGPSCRRKHAPASWPVSPRKRDRGGIAVRLQRMRGPPASRARPCPRCWWHSRGEASRGPRGRDTNPRHPSADASGLQLLDGAARETRRDVSGKQSSLQKPTDCVLVDSQASLPTRTSPQCNLLLSLARGTGPQGRERGPCAQTLVWLRE